MFVYRRTVPDLENGGNKNIYFKERFDSDVYNHAKGNMSEKFKFPLLKLAIEKNYENESIINTYRKAIEKHNENLMNNTYPDSGFDLYFSQDDVVVPNRISNLLNMNVKCEMIDWNHNCSFFPLKTNNNNRVNEKDNKINSIPYFIYPRSSISKTPLVLSNHVGIIDSGYRGNIFCAVRNIGNDDYKIVKGIRLFQVCHPNLSPFFVELVDPSELSSTERGEGGFGSTGK